MGVQVGSQDGYPGDEGAAFVGYRAGDRAAVGLCHDTGGENNMSPQKNLTIRPPLCAGVRIDIGHSYMPGKWQCFMNWRPTWAWANRPGPATSRSVRPTPRCPGRQSQYGRRDRLRVVFSSGSQTAQPSIHRAAWGCAGVITRCTSRTMAPQPAAFSQPRHALRIQPAGAQRQRPVRGLRSDAAQSRRERTLGALVFCGTGPGRAGRHRSLPAGMEASARASAWPGTRRKDHRARVRGLQLRAGQVGERLGAFPGIRARFSPSPIRPPASSRSSSSARVCPPGPNRLSSIPPSATTAAWTGGRDRSPTACPKCGPVR